MGNNVSVESPLVKDYAFYSSILVMKMLDMTWLTVYRRMTSGTAISSEDAKFYSGKKEVTLPLKTNDSVERVRRAHLNDLENIPLFIFISGLYLLTDPEPSRLNMLLKAYTAARVGHTLVYAFREVPQPARGICFGVGQGITFYMAYKVFTYFL